MAIYCNTLEGNMQYSDHPYCFTPRTYMYSTGLQLSYCNYNLVLIKMEAVNVIFERELLFLYTRMCHILCYYECTS